MAKGGPKATATDSEIALAIRSGKSDRDIARTYHVGRDRVARIRKLPSGLAVKAELDPVKAVILLELSQEETRNEFSDQLHEYTQNYKRAMKDGDVDAATKWSALRVRLLEQMIKISGIDRMRTEGGPSAQQVLSEMTDEEVERRAREILAKRQR